MASDKPFGEEKREKNDVFLWGSIKEKIFVSFKVITVFQH